MKPVTEHITSTEIKHALSLMPWWAKEKTRIYRERVKFVKKLFGPVVKSIFEK